MVRVWEEGAEAARAGLCWIEGRAALWMAQAVQEAPDAPALRQGGEGLGMSGHQCQVLAR